MPLLTRLRAAGLHARATDKATRNLGKLIKDANRARARYAVIIGEEFADGRVVVKDLDSGDQTEVELDQLESRLGTG